MPTSPTIRALRRSRGITLIDLARLTGVPARTLLAVEQGLAPLDPLIAARLALVLDVQPSELVARSPERRPLRLHPALPVLAALLAALAIALALGAAAERGHARETAPARRDPPPAQEPAPARPSPPATQPSPEAPAAAAPPPSEALSQMALFGAPPATSPPQPTPPEPPAVAEPRGCPLLAAPGHVIITQGYGVGTHAPASAWGAIDLGIDGDGDGEAEPDSTRGTFVLATHDGVADVWMNSWPGGNFVRVVNEESGWSTAYAHLDGVAVADGQSLTAGTPLGTVGTTGLSSGPHLHYEVWLRGRNLDPTAIAPCWR